MESDYQMLKASARQIAETAHFDQKRWNGDPYIYHPQRVASHFSDQPLEEIVAWLHDVVEDTDVTLADIKEEGFPEEVVLAVDAMTKRPKEEYISYITRVLMNPIARRVKIKDLEDNIPGCTKQRADKYKVCKWLLEKAEEGYLDGLSEMRRETTLPV